MIKKAPVLVSNESPLPHTTEIPKIAANNTSRDRLIKVVLLTSCFFFFWELLFFVLCPFKFLISLNYLLDKFVPDHIPFRKIYKI